MINATTAGGAVGGIGTGAVVIIAWNSFFPDHLISTEMASVIAPTIAGPVGVFMAKVLGLLETKFLRLIEKIPPNVSS
jgi:hypothetical protein